VTVAVLLNLPDDVYLALSAKATKNDTQVHIMIERVVTHSVRKPAAKPRPAPRPPRDSTDERIVELNASGHGDNQISKIIGLHQTTVSGRRRAMGLESPTPKSGWKGTAA
jgi:hypothetical protein